FGVDRSHRVLHGALLDAQLLAQVYVELTGGRQIGLTLVSDAPAEMAVARPAVASMARPLRPFAPSEDELARHRDFVAGISNALWGEA
ncbi:DNA polymerase III subunit epsilon, partial [Pseudomonas sp. FW305-47B]